MFPVWQDDVDIPMDIAIQMTQLGVDIPMYIDDAMTDDIAAARMSHVICCKEDSILTRPLTRPTGLLSSVSPASTLIIPSWPSHALSILVIHQDGMRRCLPASANVPILSDCLAIT